MTKPRQGTQSHSSRIRSSFPSESSTKGDVAKQLAFVSLHPTSMHQRDDNDADMDRWLRLWCDPIRVQRGSGHYVELPLWRLPAGKWWRVCRHRNHTETVSSDARGASLSQTFQ